MKLLACHIENFGKLSDFSMDFNEGVNVVDGPNGWGKSTLASFLKAMFYGLDPRKQRGEYEKERKRYKPWQGGIFGGELDFQVGTRKYRISRTFGDTEKSDVFHVYDLATNRESHDFSKNIGQEIFDLDSSSFRRSIFIAQNDLISTSTDGINAKLTNLVENTNDINNYEKADALLSDLMNHFSPTRATGTVKRREMEIAALEEELRGFSRAEEAYERLADKQHEQVVRFEELFAQKKMFTAELQKTGKENVRLEKRNQYEQLRQDLHAAEEKCREFAIQFPGGLPTEEEIAAFAQTSEQIREMDATMRTMSEEEGGDRNFEKLAAEFSSGVPKEEEIYAQIGRQKVLVEARDKLKDLEHQLEVKVKLRDTYRKDRELEQEKRDSMEENRRQEKLRQKNKRTAVLDVVFWFFGVLFLVGSVVVSESNILPEPYKDNTSVVFGMWIVGAVFLILAIVGLCMYGAGVKKRKHPPKEKGQESEEPFTDGGNPVLDDEQKVMTKLEKAIEDQYNEVTEMERHIELFLKKFRKDSRPEEYLESLYALANDRQDYLRIAHRRKLLQSAAETKEELQRLLEELAEAYQLAPDASGEVEFENIRVRAAEYKMANEQYEKLSRKLEQFESQNDMEELLKERRHMYTLDELNEAIRRIDEQTETVREAIAEYNKEMDHLQEQLNQQEEKEAAYEEMLQKQEEEAHKYEIADYTRRFLARAKDEFTSRYMVPVAEGFGKYYAYICGEEPGDWQLDSHMEYSVREQGELRKAIQLSVGYQDLIGICMRLALAEAMYDKEKPFLVMDDPFVNLDEDKMESARDLLMQVAKDYQVMYFTCHQVREP